MKGKQPPPPLSEPPPPPAQPTLDSSVTEKVMQMSLAALIAEVLKEESNVAWVEASVTVAYKDQTTREANVVVSLRGYRRVRKGPP